MDHLKIDQEDYYDSPLMDLTDSFEGISAVYMPDEPLNSLLSYSNETYDNSFYSYYEHTSDVYKKLSTSPKTPFRPTVCLSLTKRN